MRKIGKLVKVTLVSAGLLVLPVGCRKNIPVLKVYNFSYYIGESTISDFEKECACKVVYDNYSSNEEMIAKIQSGAKYDVVFPTDYAVKIMRKGDLLMALDHEKLSNIGNISPAFLDRGFDPGNRYTVPYHWGTCGLGFDSKVLAEPGSFDILWNSEFSGRVSVLDDARFTIGMVLKTLGFSANSTEPKELELARAKLTLLKMNVRAFSSDTYIKMLAGGEVVLAYGYSAGVLQSAADNKDIHYTVPEAGTILWMDNLAIPVTSENPALAHAFINFILRPEVIAPISNYVRAANPNVASTELLEPEIRDNKGIYPDDALVKKSEFLDDLGESNDLYLNMWTSIKSN